MTNDDMFLLFEANANGMEEFARLAGSGTLRRTREATVPRAGVEVRTLEPEQVADIEVIKRVVAAPDATKRSWWERVGLPVLATPVKRSRRRLSPTPLTPSNRATGT